MTNGSNQPNFTRFSSFTGLPKAVGPYSIAVRYDNLIFISGQIGISPETSKLISNDTGEQTNQILRNISTIFSELRITPQNVIKTTIFLTTMEDFSLVNEIYGSFFSENFPARSTIAVNALPLGAKIEIELIATTS
jgi:2-iminobutanoate/2-iminopropanoate deaminase